LPERNTEAGKDGAVSRLESVETRWGCLDQGQRPDRGIQDGGYSAALQVDTEEFAAERGLT